MSAAGCSMVHMARLLTFTKDDLKGAAGARSFERGLDYLRDVEDLDVASTQITACVYGSSKYRVRLAFGDEVLSGSCTCPYSQEGFFCKHCVAVGLAVLELGEDLPVLIEATRAERQALESWLESLSKKELLAELLGLLGEEPDLRRRFELRAASVNLDAVTVRHAVQELILLPRRGYVEYSDAYAYANDVHRAAAAIDDLTEAGGAADAIGIAREAVALLTEAFEHVDDSSGWSATPHTSCSRFICVPARPHPRIRSRSVTTWPGCCCTATMGSGPISPTTPACSVTKASPQYVSA